VNELEDDLKEMRETEEENDRIIDEQTSKYMDDLD
jgi:hypothetical protein